MAGRGRFELPEVLPSPVFKTGTFDHSDISRQLKRMKFYLKKIKITLNLEATPGFEPGIEALQAPALPLGDVATILIVVPGVGLEPTRSQ